MCLLSTERNKHFFFRTGYSTEQDLIKTEKNAGVFC